MARGMWEVLSDTKVGVHRRHVMHCQRRWRGRNRGLKGRMGKYEIGGRLQEAFEWKDTLGDHHSVMQ